MSRKFLVFAALAMWATSGSAYAQTVSQAPCNRVLNYIEEIPRNLTASPLGVPLADWDRAQFDQLRDRIVQCSGSRSAASEALSNLSIFENEMEGKVAAARRSIEGEQLSIQMFERQLADIAAINPPEKRIAKIDIQLSFLKNMGGIQPQEMKRRMAAFQEARDSAEREINAQYEQEMKARAAEAAARDRQQEAVARAKSVALAEDLARSREMQAREASRTESLQKELDAARQQLQSDKATAERNNVLQAERDKVLAEIAALRKAAAGAGTTSTPAPLNPQSQATSSSDTSSSEDKERIAAATAKCNDLKERKSVAQIIEDFDAIKQSGVKIIDVTNGKAVYSHLNNRIDCIYSIKWSSGETGRYRFIVSKNSFGEDIAEIKPEIYQ